MKTAIAIILLTFPALAQNEPRYGSLSRQMIVRENVRQMEFQRELREYRLFREEIKRLTPPEPPRDYMILSNHRRYEVCN